MYSSNDLGSGRNSSGYPNSDDDFNPLIDLNPRGRSSRNMYSNIVPARPAPPPPTSSLSGQGLGRRTSTSAAQGSSSQASSRRSGRDPLGRRGSLGVPQPLSTSGLAATRPLGFESELNLHPLQPLSGSSRRSGTRNTGLASPRLGSGQLGSGQLGSGQLGSGQLGSGLGITGGLNDENTNPVLYSRSQPIDIEPMHFYQTDWRNRLSPGPELENPTLRETRREARARTRQDWERDGELHPNVSLESDLEDSTDGETDSPIGSSQPRRRTRSLRRTPELENLRGGHDSGIGLGGNNDGRNRGFSSSATGSDFGLGSLGLNNGIGLTVGGGGGIGGSTYVPSRGSTNGYRERRTAFSSTGSTPQMDRLPELDLGGLPPPTRRSRYPPPGPAPSGPLPPLPGQGLGGLGGLGNYGGRGGLGGLSTLSDMPPLGGLSNLPPLGGRRPSLQETPGMPSMYTDPFAPRPHIPGQHRIREHMLEFTDGDYTVRIRHNQRARQQQQQQEQEQRGRTSNSGGSSSGLAEARRLGF